MAKEKTDKAEKTKKSKKAKTETTAKAAKKANGSAKKANGSAKKKATAKASKKTAKADAKKSKAETDKFGFRKGSKKSEAAAMYATKKGATLAEVKEKTGSNQLNLLKELEEKGDFKIERTKEKGKGKKPVTRYKIVA